ncbi:Os03g0163400 [Oryza sativa Japonica Group]|uniref:Os03g0163400 protein n=1 Tax=Oryza sativa subsp. japonica TaxID=39947 RepID=Q0DUW6_ORYSJ|nr:Os03g0163400 [Oryza sativa Japonica Group]|eukprot:NP_001049058.2 Os03g0163400 [Oryza sativa Japonica Group]
MDLAISCRRGIVGGWSIMLGWKGNYFPNEKRRHLYLVLDDWSRGYSIRKIDLSVGNDGDGEHSMPPAIFSFEAPRAGPKYFAGAFDSKILAMQPVDPQFSFNPMAGIPIYDVRMRSLVVGPRQRPDPVDPIYIPVGGRLFALSVGSFQLLYPPPDDESDDQEEEEDFVWGWHALPNPPFQHEHVTSYAVHRDGRTIFVSIGGESSATFSFDTAESVRNGCMWKNHGQWQLPFSGRAYFIAELDAWVGLSRKPGTTTSWRICSMDVISDDCENGQAVKYTREELATTVSDHELVTGVTLVSMGGGSKFCVVECCLDHSVSVPFIQLVTFSMMYGKNGELTTGNSRQFREYKNIPQGVSSEMLENPVAFWM